MYLELAGSSRGPTFRANDVSTTPTITVKTLMPSGASSRRIVSEILFKAALEEQYAPGSERDMLGISKIWSTNGRAISYQSTVC